METEFFQVILKFNDEVLKADIENAIRDLNEDNFFIDESIDEALAADPLTLGLLVAMIGTEVIKTLAGESGKLIFEKLKNIFAKKKTVAKNDQSVEIRLKDQIFIFKYDSATGNYTVSELK